MAARVGSRVRAHRRPDPSRHAARIGGELRGYLTVVPESRWIKHAAHQEWFFGEMTEHYEEHLKELQAILDTVRA